MDETEEEEEEEEGEEEEVAIELIHVNSFIKVQVVFWASYLIWSEWSPPWPWPMVRGPIPSGPGGGSAGADSSHRLPGLVAARGSGAGR